MSGSALPHQQEALKDMDSLNKQLGTTGKSHQEYSDIGKMKTEADGSFKRKDATFRSCISRDGEFTPEKGTHTTIALYCLCILTYM